ncbi:acyl carrier protein [Saccharomonospora sp. NB11]|jgi:acyl carrier protein|uniref:acyl carrier protein n=1 Tax=Saccharomonospora sp. NB11 TaxID=1642298 RepID=UPI0018D12DD6|nr:acyl carrier protein [Saccharomonospora sp. NB11]
MDGNVFEVVDELFRRRLAVAELDPDAPLVNYGLDSVRSIDLIVELEGIFGLEISDEQAASMQTLRDVVTQVAAALPVEAGRGNADR